MQLERILRSVNTGIDYTDRPRSTGDIAGKRKIIRIDSRIPTETPITNVSKATYRSRRAVFAAGALTLTSLAYLGGEAIKEAVTTSPRKTAADKGCVLVKKDFRVQSMGETVRNIVEEVTGQQGTGLIKSIGCTLEAGKIETSGKLPDGRSVDVYKAEAPAGR